MSYFNLYVKKPVTNSSVIEEVSLMIDVVKPSRKTFIIGLARHIVTTQSKSTELTSLIEMIQSVIVKDEYLLVEDDILVDWIKDDKYLKVSHIIKKDTESVEVVGFSEDITVDNISYVTTIDLWSSYTNSLTKKPCSDSKNIVRR